MTWSPCAPQLLAEHHIDVLSVQAALASRQFSWLDRTAQYLKFTSRVG